jgi:hypothetical protein
MSISKLLMDVYNAAPPDKKTSPVFQKSFEYANNFFNSVGGKQYIQVLKNIKQPIIFIDFLNMVLYPHDELLRIKKFRLSKITANGGQQSKLKAGQLKAGQSVYLQKLIEVFHNFIIYLSAAYPQICFIIVNGNTFHITNVFTKTSKNIYEIDVYRPTHYETDDIVIVVSSIMMGAHKHCILSRDFYSWAHPSLKIGQKFCMLLLKDQELKDIVEMAATNMQKCDPHRLTCDY